MEKARADNAPALVCSAGDFYGTADVFNEPKSHFVARMMGQLAYDAIGVGEMDLNFGLDALMGDVEAYRLNVVCANIFERSPEGAIGGSVFAQSRVVDSGGVRVGFTSLLSPNTKIRRRGGGSISETKSVEAMTYVIQDPESVAGDVLRDLRGRSDVVVLLAHMDDFELESLLGSIDTKVDFAVLGHDPQTAPLGQPRQMGETTVLKATAQGQCLGEIAVTIGADGSVAGSGNRIHYLDAAIPDDPEVIAIIEAFEAENRKVQKELYAKEQFKASQESEAGGGAYLGIGACQSCHVEQFDIHIGTSHARAYETLASQFVHHDTNCVGCHVTGYGEPGGFGGLRRRGSMTDLIDVQCEACHGPGENHRRDGSYRVAAIESCVRCHTTEDDPDFNFATDWPKIAH